MTPEHWMMIGIFAACFLLIVCLMATLIKRHGAGIDRARRAAPPKKGKKQTYDAEEIPGGAVACAVGGLICGALVAMNPFGKFKG